VFHVENNCRAHPDRIYETCNLTFARSFAAGLFFWNEWRVILGFQRHMKITLHLMVIYM